MKRHLKKIVLGIAALLVLVIAGSWFYTKVLNDPQDAKTAQDAVDIVQGTTSGTTGDTTADTAGETTSTAVATTVALEGPVDGDWAPTSESELCYRVKETINGFATEGVGCTNVVSGAMTLEGTTLTSADFTVDMTTFTSDKTKRDESFNGKVMEVATYPTGTFVLTSPVDFGAVPAEGETITVTATGDLTLHGVTKSVTFDLSAAYGNDKIGVFGKIPVLFADYGIDNPSFAVVSTEDNGLLEFVLAFERA